MKSLIKHQFLILLALPTYFLSAQDKLSNRAIWELEFEPQKLESIHPLKSQSAYSVLEVDYKNRISKIVLYDYATALELEVLVDSSLSPLIPFFTDYEFSEDEQKILLATQEQPIYRRSKQAIYYIYDRPSRKTNLLYGDKVQEPRFSKNGSKVAFVYQRNLYIKNLQENTLDKITHDGNKHLINGLTDWVYEEEFGFVRAYDWNTAGTAIAFLRFDENHVPEFSMDIYGQGLYQFPYTFKYPKAGENNAKVSLHIYHLENKTTNEVRLGDEPIYYIPQLKFSPNENHLIVQTINRRQDHLKLWRFNLSNGMAEILLNERSDTYVDVHDDLRFMSNGDFLWSSERDGYKHLYHYKANGTLKRQLTQGPWEVTKFYGYNEKSKEIYYASVEKSSIERVIYALTIDGDKKRILTPNHGYNGLVFSANYNYYIHTYEDAQTPPIYTLRKTKNSQVVRTIEDNSKLKDKLVPFSLAKKDFSTLKVNGEELNMYMIKPLDFDATKSYPLLMFQYSGPGSQKVANKWHDQRDLWHQLLVQRGYIIVCVDGRGTGFKGVKFKKSTYLQLTKYETQDQIAAAHHLSKLPYVDANRIGIWGWSYGGHMATNCILKGNDIFSLAIAVAPVTNWRFYDTIYTERFMRTPQENPEGYDLNSPLNYAHLLKGKYLLIHGTGDDNVHVQNSMRMVEALVQANKPFEWALYPDKNHGINGGNTSVHLYNKMTKFIQDNL